MQHVRCHISLASGARKEDAMGSNEPVLLRRDEDGIAWLTLNRQARREQP
jgi:hypothetical protein